MERVAEGVWLLRGDLRGMMNVYFIEDGDGIVQFDAGSRGMTRKAHEAAAQLGGLKRVVLGHAHADHRGTAPYMGVPVHCHRDAVAEAEDPAPITPYMDLAQLPTLSRWIFRFQMPRWDGGAVRIDDMVEEGDEVAGFRVVHLPGHAPGLIALWREGDRVALTSDVVYLADSARLRPLPEGEASVPHPAWNMDHAQAKESVRKLAALDPAVVCPGHLHPLRGESLRATLEQAAERY